MKEKVSIAKPIIIPVLWEEWEDIPDTYDKPRLCKIADPECEACQ